jgi:hypothetical protein
MSQELYLQVLTLGRQSLGSEHPNIAAVFNNLGTLYQDQGSNTEAEQCYHQALAILEKTKNPNLSGRKGP